MNFMIHFSISAKNTIGILIGITLNLRIALGSIDNATILSPIPRTWDVCPFICSFQNFFQQHFKVCSLWPLWLNLYLFHSF